MTEETDGGRVDRTVGRDDLRQAIATKLSAEGVCWHETARGVAVLNETCAPTRLVCAYLIARLAEELQDQLNAPRGNGYDLELGTIRGAWEAVDEATRWIGLTPNAAVTRRTDAGSV